jgi:hypothetical protein
MFREQENDQAPAATLQQSVRGTARWIMKKRLTMRKLRGPMKSGMVRGYDKQLTAKCLP